MDLVTLLPLLLVGVFFYLLILRPAKKRQQQQQATLNAVRPGQRIMTTAGLFGTITDVTDDEIGLEIAPGIVVRYVKAAVAKVVVEEDEATGIDEAVVLTDDADSAAGAGATAVEPGTSKA